jgi:GntR family transcriptional repressor for pyruvate dehydrogenase complex
MSSAVTPSFDAISRRPSLSQEVLQRLVEMLETGKLAPGDRLPPERGLAQMMGISRPSLREGLRALTALGILSSTQGRGTYLVESLDRLPLEPYMLQLLLNNGKLGEFIELRRIIEPAVAALAAQGAGERERSAITEAWEAYERAVQKGDLDEESEAGSQFHLSLTRATGNTLLVQLMESLHDLMRETGRVVLSRHAGASQYDHRALYEAVMGRRPAVARRLMRDHLDSIDRRVKGSVDSDSDELD